MRSEQAILVVSFGTSYRETREKTIGAIEAYIAEQFPDWTVARAFTSGMVIRSIEKKEGIHVDSVPEALDRLVSGGVRRVIVQPTHLMPGMEYQKMLAALETYQAKFERIVTGRPLLASGEDLRAAAGIIEKIYAECPKEDAVVLMGHGTEAASDRVYMQLQNVLRGDGAENIYIGTVEGAVTLQDVLEQMKARSCRHVTGAPLMVVAGDHGTNDLAGDEPDSWKSILKAEGYEVEIILRGLGEYPQIQELYAQHAREAMERIG